MIHIDPSLIPFLQEMLYELEENKLTVEKVEPDPSHPNSDIMLQNGRKIRAAVIKNPEWYSKLCKLYPRQKDKHNRKDPRCTKHPRTRVKRRNVLLVLKWIIKNGQSSSQYTEYLIGIAESYKEAEEYLRAVNENLKSVIAEEEAPF